MAIRVGGFSKKRFFRWILVVIGMVVFGSVAANFQKFGGFQYPRLGAFGF